MPKGTEYAAALAELKLKAQTSLAPEVSDGECEIILARHQFFVPWSPNTVYHFGDHVQAAEYNGVRYSCVRTGTSGASEPAWATYPIGYGDIVPSFLVIEDGTVWWREDSVWRDRQYDINAAICECINLKIARVPHLVDFTSGQKSVRQSQMVANLERLRAQYQTFYVG